MITSAQCHEIIELFRKYTADLAVLRIKTEKSLQNVPDGRVVVRLCKGKYPQYYLNESKKAGKEQYVGSKVTRKIQLLLQKEYDQKLLRAVIEMQSAIEIFLNAFDPDALESAYRSLSEPKQGVVTPAILPDELYIEEWHNAMKEKRELLPNPFPFAHEIRTENGEYVRSKSEKIIADKLLKMNIPYEYEVPLKLKNTRIIYPDFTLLNVKQRKTVYYEHFGLMENMEYCEKAIEKIQLYEMNDLWEGDRFLYTFESDEVPLDTDILEQILLKFLL